MGRAPRPCPLISAHRDLPGIPWLRGESQKQRLADRPTNQFTFNRTSFQSTHSVATMSNPEHREEEGKNNGVISEAFDEDESSVSTAATDTPSVQSTPTPKSPKQKKRHKKSSSKKSKKSPGLTEAEQDLYNAHADQIRLNAMQLLNTEVSPTSNRYRSYHDQPPTVSNSSDHASATGNNLPPWSSNNANAQSSYGVGDALSVSQVASMAFSCIAHCLTEGYRAASNYYSETQAGEDYNHNYAKVGGENHVGEIPHGYQDGYQQQMDRGLNSNQSSGQGSTEQKLHVKGEYATVSMPSTYQGGSK